MLWLAVASSVASTAADAIMGSFLQDLTLLIVTAEYRASRRDGAFNREEHFNGDDDIGYTLTCREAGLSSESPKRRW